MVFLINCIVGTFCRLQVFNVAESLLWWISTLFDLCSFLSSKKSLRHWSVQSTHLGSLLSRYWLFLHDCHHFCPICQSKLRQPRVATYSLFWDICRQAFFVRVPTLHKAWIAKIFNVKNFVICSRNWISIFVETKKMHGGGVGGGAAFEDAEELRDPWQVKIILVQLSQNWYWSLQFWGNRCRCGLFQNNYCLFIGVYWYTYVCWGSWWRKCRSLIVELMFNWQNILTEGLSTNAHAV